MENKWIKTFSFNRLVEWTKLPTKTINYFVIIWENKFAATDIQCSVT